RQAARALQGAALVRRRASAREQAGGGHRQSGRRHDRERRSLEGGDLLMGLIRDLWNDTDPIKWVIFGGAAAALLAGGALAIQTSRLNGLQAELDKALGKPGGARGGAPG